MPAATSPAKTFASMAGGRSGEVHRHHRIERRERASVFLLVPSSTDTLRKGLAASGWPGIYEYVRRRHASEFGLDGWTDHSRLDPGSGIHKEAVCRLPHSERCRATIGNFSARWMLSSSLAMITKPTFEMAQPFLEAGLPVFIDKPLSLDISELRASQAVSGKRPVDVLFRHALCPRIG